jgi:hypothetical protein
LRCPAGDVWDAFEHYAPARSGVLCFRNGAEGPLTASWAFPKIHPASAPSLFFKNFSASFSADLSGKMKTVCRRSPYSRPPAAPSGGFDCRFLSTVPPLGWQGGNGLARATRRGRLGGCGCAQRLCFKFSVAKDRGGDTAMFPRAHSTAAVQEESSDLVRSEIDECRERLAQGEMGLYANWRFPY